MAKGIGGFFSDLMGSSTNQKFYKPVRNEDAYSYGGSKQAAQYEIGDARQRAMQTQAREGTQVDYGKAQADRELDWRARGNQTEALSMLQARARGESPSIAQMSADRNMRAAAAEQSSAAAGARGPAAMALAQQNAAANTAGAQSSIAGQAAIAEAQERQAAQNAYLAGSGQVRGMDQSRQGLAAQQAQYQAGLSDQQRARNDAMEMGHWNRMDRMQGMQMQGQMGYDQAQAGDTWQQQGAVYGQRRDNAKAAGDAFGGAMSSVAGLAALASDVRAKQGISDLSDPMGQKRYADPGAMAGDGVLDVDVQRQAMLDAGTMPDAGKALPASAFVSPPGKASSFSDVYQANEDKKAEALKKQNAMNALTGGLKMLSDISAKQHFAPAGTPGGAAMDVGSIAGLTGLLSDEKAKNKDPMSDALRALSGSVYEYKPEHLPPDQEPGEKNVGPMAQSMAADPLAGTAVEKREDGMLQIDGPKALKLSMAGLAHLQKQLDELKAKKGKG